MFYKRALFNRTSQNGYRIGSSQGSGWSEIEVAPRPKGAANTRARSRDHAKVFHRISPATLHAADRPVKNITVRATLNGTTGTHPALLSCGTMCENCSHENP
jgi:hypothetical protein